MRNIVDNGLGRPVGGTRSVLRGWATRTPVPYGGQVTVLHRLPRSVRVLPHLVGRPSALACFILEFWGHMRWWADGALGNRGRMEGGQYLAGRRAPPLLHRESEGLSDAGGLVCQPRFYRTF